MIAETLTMIPGPTPVHARILGALARPTVSHLAAEVAAALQASQRGLLAVCRCSAGRAVIVGGGGTLAMEMGLVNLVPVGGRVLVVSQGYFGDRFAELAAAFGIGCDTLGSEWGRAVEPEEVAAAVGRRRYDAVTITHVDTSTGTCAPVGAYCAALRGSEALIVLDGVCATAGIDEPFDAWGLDVLLTAPQKAIGAPPGLALCVFSARALERRHALPRVPAYYADVLRWLPVMEDPGRYFSTHAVNEIWALAEAFAMIDEEGLEQRLERHARLAAAFRAGLEALGLELFTHATCRAATLSVPLVPDGVADPALRRELAARGVVVAGGLGPLAGRGFRVGHMGNVGAGEIAATLTGLEGALASCGWRTRPGAAVAAAAPLLAEAAPGGPRTAREGR